MTAARILRRATRAALLLALASGPAVLGSSGAGASATTKPAPQIVVIAVPDLRWIDLEVMPALAAYAATAAVGDLAVRAEPSASRCADGSLTFAAGNRADAGGTTGCSLTLAIRQQRQAALRGDRYGADIGALGSALQAAHLTTAAVGPDAELLLGNAAGSVSSSVPADDLSGALATADVISLVDPQLYDASGARDLAAKAADAVIAAQLAAIPAGDTVIVAGTSDARTGGPHLHALIVHGAGWPHRQLTSASAGAGYVQLVDLAPTILAGYGLAVPAAMIGRPVTVSADAAQRPAAYADIDRHAVVGLRWFDGITRTLFGAFGLLVIALLALARWTGSRTASGAAVVISRLVIGLPLASYLIQVVPWWRWPAPGYVAGEVLVALVLAGLMTAAARWGRRWALLVVPSLTFVILAVDQLVGAPLQNAAPLGNQPVVAGRFTGIGNIAFALLCAGALIAAALVGGGLLAAGRRQLALAVGAAICLVALVVDAGPSLGDDFGGVLAMTPAAALLLVMLAGIRLTWRRLVLVVVGVVVVGVGLAAADYARPAADRTHIGTFAGQVIHGGAGKVISRKLYAQGHSFGNVAVTGLVVVIVVGAVVARRQLGAWLRPVAGLPEAAVAVAVLAVLGSALNDSGVVVAEFAAGTALLAIVGAGVLPPGSSADPTRSDLPPPD